MADPSVSEFRLAYPEFSDTACFTDQRLQFWIEQVCGELSSDVWGTCFNQGVYTLLAHKLMSQESQKLETSSQLGVIGTGKQLGANQHNQVNISRQDWNSVGMETTAYGREHIRLRNNLHPSWFLTV